MARRIEFTRGFVFYALALFYLVPAKILVAFFLAAAMHELAHIAVLYLCRCRVKRLIFGAADVQIVHGALSSRKALWCALAGPVANLLCGGLFLKTASEFAAASLLLGGFNLLPILPLDGGQMLRAVLQMRLEFERAEHLAERVGYVTCAMIFAAAVFAVFRMQVGLWPLLPASVLPVRMRMMEKAVAFPPNRG